MNLKLIVFLIVGIVRIGLSQSYFLNISLGNSLHVDNTNKQEQNFLLSDNSNLKIATNGSRFDFFSFTNLNLGISINKILNERSIIELKLLNDGANMNLYSTYATAQPSTVNFINVTGNSIKFSYSIYNFSFRYNFLLNSTKSASTYQGIKTKVFLLSAIDIFTPSFNALLNKSGSIYGIESISYSSANGLNKIDVTYTIKNSNRISFRPCFGLSMKIIKKNKSLFNLQTYWGFNALHNLAEGFVSVYENNLFVAERKYKLTASAWYFNISKDITFKKKSKPKNR